MFSGGSVASRTPALVAGFSPLSPRPSTGMTPPKIRLPPPPTRRASAAVREMRQRAMSGDGVMRLIAREIVGDRKFPPVVGRQYRAVFVGKEAVDLLLAKVRH